MVYASVKPITLQEFLALPETKPASEYIDGQIIQKPMPKGRHSIIRTELSSAINLALRPKSIATAFTELRCTFGNRSTVPDIAAFENLRIPQNERAEIEDIFTIAPDWTIEILSPNQSPLKVLKNISHCLLSGCQMGWLVDPEERSVLICQPRNSLLVIDEADTILPVLEFASSIQLTLSSILGWLKAS